MPFKIVLQLCVSILDNMKANISLFKKGRKNVLKSTLVKRGSMMTFEIIIYN